MTYIDPVSSQIGHKESIADTARVLGRFYDGIEFRGSRQDHVDTLAELSGVPVWNGLTDDWHPTQMLGEQLTMRERSGKDYSEMSFAYLGNARNNVANSLMISGAMMGMDVRMVGPRTLWNERIALLRDYQINVDLMAATDNPNTKFMHCLPAFHDRDTEVGAAIFRRTDMDALEVTNEVFEEPQSIVFDQTENRMHPIKTVMVATLGEFEPGTLIAGGDK